MKTLYTVLLFSFFFTSAVSAQPISTHSVREGDTLASIAQQYYADPTREEVVRRANDLPREPKLLAGSRLTIPMSTFHRVRPTQSWRKIADEVYGATHRASVLVEANDASLRVQPDEGTELVVPFPLRHVANEPTTLSKIARAYFGEGRRHVSRIRKFNSINGNRISRGQVVLVPLVGLQLSEEARAALAKSVQSTAFGAKTQQAQTSAEQELPQLIKLARSGAYAESIALGNKMLGTGRLTSTQRVDIQRTLATAYIAIDRKDLAVASFLSALKKQPSLELDSITTSPKVLKAFAEAKAKLTRSQTAP